MYTLVLNFEIIKRKHNILFAFIHAAIYYSFSLSNKIYMYILKEILDYNLPWSLDGKLVDQ